MSSLFRHCPSTLTKYLQCLLVHACVAVVASCIVVLERYYSPSIIRMVKLLTTRKAGQNVSQGRINHVILLYCGYDYKGRVSSWNGLDASGLGHYRIP